MREIHQVREHALIVKRTMANRSKSPPSTERSSDVPESKCDNATPVYRLVLAYGNEPVSLLVRLVVIMSKRDVIVRVEVTSDVCEGEPAYLDETEGLWGSVDRDSCPDCACANRRRSDRGRGRKLLGFCWNWGAARTQRQRQSRPY